MSANDRVKHCRLHDLLRDLSISKSRLEQFFVFQGNLDSLPLAKARHHVVYTSSVQSLDDVSPNLRSLLFFKASDRNRGMNISLDAFFLPCLGLISKSFKLIRVLDLEDMKLKELPSSIGELIHLKYLGLRDNRLERLPFEVGKLTNLQTLDIAENCFCNHHNIFWKMKNLRHLYMNVRGGRKNLKIETLRNLQTLLDIGVEDWLATNPAKLINLRKLGLRGNFRINRVEIFNSLAKLLCLQSLFLYTDENLVFPSLSQLSSLRRVIKLQMRGEIRKPPSPDEFPPNLTQLILHKSRFKDDPMEMLKKLPYLFVLRLKASSYVGEKMKVSAGGFAQLEILELEYLELLEELDVEESALPKLKSFHISSCFRLTNISEGMKFVTTLQELEIKQMRKRFTDRLQGEDYYKVQHVPSIKIL
ncbi:LRR domain containing protein [Trema orientale]|uniref:LRR domain containing protein n=1 Tax=Trema orientale TaxID=63057 RepID=A0A2P5AGC6_TREOI|nr:LRR domain containing protein [Trema orientale]